MLIEHLGDLHDSSPGSVDDALHRFHGNGTSFAPADDLDHLPGRGADEVQVEGSTAIFLIIEVDEQFLIQDSGTHSQDERTARVRGEDSTGEVLLDQQAHCDRAGIDGGGPGTAIGVEHVAIDSDGVARHQ